MKKRLIFSAILVALSLQSAIYGMEQVVLTSADVQKYTKNGQEAQQKMKTAFDTIKNHFEAGTLTDADVDAFAKWPSLTPLEIRQGIELEAKTVVYPGQYNALILFFNDGFAQEVISYLDALSQEAEFEPNEKAQAAALVRLIDLMFKGKIESKGAALGKVVTLPINNEQQLVNSKSGVQGALSALKKREQAAVETLRKEEGERMQQAEGLRQLGALMEPLKRGILDHNLSQDVVKKALEKPGELVEPLLPGALIELVNGLGKGQEHEYLKNLKAKIQSGVDLTLTETAFVLALGTLVEFAQRKFRTTPDEGIVTLIEAIKSPVVQKVNAEILSQQLSTAEERAGIREVVDRLKIMRQHFNAGTLQVEEIWRGLVVSPLKGTASQKAFAFTLAELFDRGFSQDAIKYLNGINEKLAKKEQLTKAEQEQTKAVIKLIELAQSLSGLISRKLTNNDALGKALIQMPLATHFATGSGK